MNASQIRQVLEEFEGDSIYNCILLDGKWGIGKTYQVSKYLEDVKKRIRVNKKHHRLKVIYESLFGKTSISEIHNELFQKIHPKKDLTFKFVSVASNLLSVSAQYISANPSAFLPFIKKQVKSKKGSTIIIFDDLERIGTDLSYKNLLGYFNKLLAENIRIICISNLEQISNREDSYQLIDFTDFREKIFEREYKIDEPEDNIMDSIFKDHKKYLDNKTVEVFNSNLRLAIKTRCFFEECINKIENDKEPLAESIYRDILFHAALCIEDIHKNTPPAEQSDSHNEPSDRYNKLPNSYNVLSNSYNERDNIYAKNKYIKRSVNIRKSIPQICKSELLNALFYIYYNDTVEPIIEYIQLLNNESINELDKKVHLESDQGKMQLIRKQYEEIINKPDILYKYDLFGIIHSWLHYYDFQTLSSEVNMQSLCDQIVNLLIERKIDLPINTRAMDLFYSGKDMQEFTRNISNCYEEKIISNYIESLNEETDENKMIEIIEQSEKYLVFKQQGLPPEFPSRLIDEFIKNKFYMPYLNGTITEKQWRLAQQICITISKYAPSKKCALKAVLQDMCKHEPNDQALKSRVDGLIKEFNL